MMTTEFCQNINYKNVVKNMCSQLNSMDFNVSVVSLRIRLSWGFPIRLSFLVLWEYCFKFMAASW